MQSESEYPIAVIVGRCERIASMKDAATEITPCVSRRDMGTSTQSLSLSHSLSHSLSSTPTKSKTNSPPRHNTPAPTPQPFAALTSSTTTLLNEDDYEYECIRVQKKPLGRERLQLFDKNELLSYYYYTTTSSNRVTKKEEEGWKSFLPMDCSSNQVEISNGEEEEREKEEREEEVRGSTLAWEEAQRAKLVAQYKKQEAKIQAWENLEKAKAEAELKKIELKLDQLRDRAIQKIANKLQLAQKRSKEMRALIATRKIEQMAKVQARVAQIRKTGKLPSPNQTICFACLSFSSTM